MNTPAQFSRLTTRQCHSLVHQCSDLVIYLSSDMTVTQTANSGDFDSKVLDAWVEQPLQAIIAKDSQPKIKALLDDNAAVHHEGGKWRHLNFQTSDGQHLPLLVKFFRFVQEGHATHLLSARDLRPLSEVQQKWQKQQENIEKICEEQFVALQRQMGVDRALTEITGMVGQLSFEQILQRGLQHIETLCLEEALSRAGGQLADAAALVGLPADEFSTRLKCN